MVLAGRHGVGALSFGAFVGVRGAVDLSAQWRVAEKTAAEHGKTVRRDDWRLVVPVYLADSRREAINDIAERAAEYLVEYSQKTLGRTRPVDGTPRQVVERLVDSGSWIVGTPHDCCEAIRRFDELTGGYGGLMIVTHEWASRQKILRSYELLARYVMPRFQGSLVGLETSLKLAQASSQLNWNTTEQAIERAHQDYDATATIPTA
jgi:limonene 1,2-monooxygenase